MNSLREQISAQNEMVKTLLTSNSTLQHDVAVLKSCSLRQGKTIEHLKSNNSVLHDSISRIKSQNFDLKNEINALKLKEEEQQKSIDVMKYLKQGGDNTTIAFDFDVTNTSEMTAEIRSINSKFEHQRELIDRLKSNNSIQQNTIESLKSQLDFLEIDSRHRNHTMYAMKSDMVAIYSDLRNSILQNGAAIIDTGYVSCSRSGGWSRGSYGFKLVEDQFKVNYTQTPVAFSSLRQWEQVGGGSPSNKLGFGAYVHSVNTTHITVGCYKGREVSDLVEVRVNWITFPQ